MAAMFGKDLVIVTIFTIPGFACGAMPLDRTNQSSFFAATVARIANGIDFYHDISFRIRGNEVCSERYSTLFRLE